MRADDFESGCLYWLPETHELPPQRAVLIEISRERDSFIFEILPMDRQPGRVQVEFARRDWAVEKIEPCYD